MVIRVRISNGNDGHHRKIIFLVIMLYSLVFVFSTPIAQKLQGYSRVLVETSSEGHHNKSTRARLAELEEEFEITTTDFGWTTSEDLKFGKRQFSSEVFDAVQAHHRYSPDAWREVNANPDKYPDRKLVVFLDVDSCNENCWPLYGVSWWLNADTANNRTSGNGFKGPVQESCKYIVKAAQSPALAANPRSRLFVLDCGPPTMVTDKSVQERGWL